MYAYYSGGWNYEIVEDGNYGGSNFLALNSNDNPYIAYNDMTNADLKYAYHDTEWHIETVDAAGDVGDYVSIELDSDDNPHICYFDDTNDKIKYAFFNGSWHIETVDDALVGFKSIALDDNDNPHLLYYFQIQNPMQYYLKYASYDQTWHIETIETGPLGDIFFINSLALDAYDNPHISFIGYNPDGNARIKYAFKQTAQIPTLSQWGMLIMGLLLAAFGTATDIFRRKRIAERGIA